MKDHKENYSVKIIHDFKLTGDIERDSYSILTKNGCAITAEHSQRVANECARLAQRFGEDIEEATVAGYLHDISAIVPNEKKLDIALKLGIEILSEEKEFPMILHQKLSRIMAHDIWKIRNDKILGAIGCHTTLRENPSPLDMILFISDKLHWDQDGEPPYMNELKKGLDISLEHASFAFIRYQLDNKSNLKVVHPWLIGAYNCLQMKLGL